MAPCRGLRLANLAGWTHSSRPAEMIAGSVLVVVVVVATIAAAAIVVAAVAVVMDQ